MTTEGGVIRTNGLEARQSTVVWIDAREAVVVRRQGSRARIERAASDVPAHHRATGHVRHDPEIRHGGGDSPQTAGEPHRLEHLKRFVVDIANRLPEDDDLLIIGPGTVHERLARLISDSDRHRGRHRGVTCEVSPPVTDRQLVARLRRFAGVEPRRQTIGAYRWSQPWARGPSGRALLSPRRIVNKPARERAHDARGE